LQVKNHLEAGVEVVEQFTTLKLGFVQELFANFELATIQRQCINFGQLITVVRESVFPQVTIQILAVVLKQVVILEQFEPVVIPK